MKLKINFIAVGLLIVNCHHYSQAQSLSTGDGWPYSHGINISKFPTGTNTYPVVNFAGDCEDEMNHYVERARKLAFIPEIMPVEQDTNGNWGALTADMQLSARFRKREYIQGDKVPVLVILRNAGETTRTWWRNALPDMGFHFTLYYGTNTATWFRPQKEKLPRAKWQGGEPFANMDPYYSGSSPHMEEFTGVDINRFFDVSQPGEYSLQVQIQVPTVDGKGITNIISGTAKFEIVEKKPR